MSLYKCLVPRFVVEVAENLVIEARDDALDRILADEHLAGHPSYASVEMFADDRRFGQNERPRLSAQEVVGQPLQ
jgi:hypothetical protein